MNPALPIGTKTQFGTIQAIQWSGGERYYFIIDRRGTVSYMPASAVEAA